MNENKKTGINKTWISKVVTNKTQQKSFNHNKNSFIRDFKLLKNVDVDMKNHMHFQLFKYLFINWFIAFYEYIRTEGVIVSMKIRMISL